MNNLFLQNNNITTEDIEDLKYEAENLTKTNFVTNDHYNSAYHKYCHDFGVSNYHYSQWLLDVIEHLDA